MTIFRNPAIRRFRQDAKGVAAIEFAIIGSVLMMFIIGIIEIGLMMAAQNVLDNATFLASRTGKTGYKNSGQTQQDTILASVKRGSARYLDSSKVTMTSLAYADYGDIGQPEPFSDLNKNGKRDSNETFTDVNGNGSYDLDQGKSGYGASAQIVVYTAKYDWKTLTPMMSRLLGSNGVVPLKARIVVKNEPYG